MVHSCLLLQVHRGSPIPRPSAHRRAGPATAGSGRGSFGAVTTDVNECQVPDVPVPDIGIRDRCLSDRRNGRLDPLSPMQKRLKDQTQPNLLRGINPGDPHLTERTMGTGEGDIRHKLQGIKMMDSMMRRKKVANTKHRVNEINLVRSFKRVLAQR